MWTHRTSEPQEILTNFTPTTYWQDPEDPLCKPVTQVTSADQIPELIINETAASTGAAASGLNANSTGAATRAYTHPEPPCTA